MDETPFLEKVAELTAEPLVSLNENTPITPAEWDSIAILDLIAAIDESFGVTVPVQSLNECKTVGELQTLIRSSR